MIVHKHARPEQHRYMKKTWIKKLGVSANKWVGVTSLDSSDHGVVRIFTAEEREEWAGQNARFLQKRDSHGKNH
ncbi:hypothetical protein C7450_12246 [Chelatococcus asaccharovorans]|uniref:Uncharacterized protein n=1 Tax=Chelatococcus asaccharovorans TaxID=28210 RepID=A0A2V3TTH5_9HYPH|nr:hypothetical protein C7450_12246 [Chelatococcus asaccharovorans]